MDEINLNNSSCKEVVKIKRLYWVWYDNLINIEKVKRTSQWRINNIELASGIEFKELSIDVTEWQLEEGISNTSNGPLAKKSISGFTPKLNELMESYINEMSRRDVVIAYETFDGVVYLFGGQNCKSSLEFNKKISGRNGYDFSFVNIGDESSLIINDTDYFPAAPSLSQTILEVNGEEFTTLSCGNTYDLVVKDADGNVVGEKIGSEWIVPASASQDGVLLEWPTGQQYTSFRTGDEGNRIQNNFFDYVKPAYPKAIAQLDNSLGANRWWRLTENVEVAGVSSKIRFVDVDGGQTWSGTGDKNRITIDKLTGLGFYRKTGDLGGAKTWNSAIDDALSFSTVVDGVTYSDWYIASAEEVQALFGEIGSITGSTIADPVSGNNILEISAVIERYWTSTTQSNSGGANAYIKGWNPSTFLTLSGKTSTWGSIYIFDARSLITAP